MTDVLHKSALCGILAYTNISNGDQVDQKNADTCQGVIKTGTALYNFAQIFSLCDYYKDAVSVKCCYCS